MALIAPERDRARRRRGAVRGAAIGLAIVAVALAAGTGWLAGLLPGVDSPFDDRRVDRSPPALLKSIRELRQYRAATGNFQVIVDLEKDTSGVPSFVKGERTLFVAGGSVDAGVDFSRLDAKAIAVSGDRRAATLTLPRAVLFDAHVDLERSRVFDRERGLIDRIGAAFSDDPADQRELYLLAERKLEAAARDGSGLREAAERNTRAMVESLLRGLGFERVVVRFG